MVLNTGYTFSSPGMNFSKTPMAGLHSRAFGLIGPDVNIFSKLPGDCNGQAGLRITSLMSLLLLLLCLIVKKL